MRGAHIGREWCLHLYVSSFAQDGHVVSVSGY
jgi:hypothetical protein